MSIRSPLRAFSSLATVLSLLVAFGALGCSGESSADSNDDDDDTGGTNTGGTNTGGTGGSGTGGSSGTPPECELDILVDPTALIDDMEDANSLAAPVGGRNGTWWISSDGTEGTITPPAEAAAPPERILGGRCESELGMRITGQGFTDWGANISLTFHYETDFVPYDASTFAGVMFWARAGETHNSPVRVQFQDSNTHGSGGICTDDPAAGNEQCWDGWGVDVAPLSTSWRLYKLDFSRMTQRGFGHSADALDPTALISMEWDFAANSVFDLFIDDVWFYE